MNNRRLDFGSAAAPTKIRFFCLSLGSRRRPLKPLVVLLVWQDSLVVAVVVVAAVGAVVGATRLSLSQNLMKIFATLKT